MSDINDKLNQYLQEEKDKKDKKNEDKFIDDGNGILITKFKKSKESNK